MSASASDALGCNRARVELTELADLVGVRPLAVLPGHLEHDREMLQLAMCEEGAEPIADQALPDVLVPVAVRSERRLRVVCVKRAEAVEPDPFVELRENGSHRC